jgi:hypothetical protein
VSRLSAFRDMLRVALLDEGNRPSSDVMLRIATSGYDHALKRLDGLIERRKEQLARVREEIARRRAEQP